MDHRFSFIPYTAAELLRAGGWKIEESEFTFGKWSWLARLINAVGSLCPSRVATGLVFYCSRFDSVASAHVEKI